MKSRLKNYIYWRYNPSINKFEICEKDDKDDSLDKKNWNEKNYFSPFSLRHVNEVIIRMNMCIDEMKTIYDRLK